LAECGNSKRENTLLSHTKVWVNPRLLIHFCWLREGFSTSYLIGTNKDPPGAGWGVDDSDGAALSIDEARTTTIFDLSALVQYGHGNVATLSGL